MNKKTEIASITGLSLLTPSLITLIAIISGGVSGGEPADFQLLLSFTIASLFAGTGILLLTFEVIELRSFIEEGLKILNDKIETEA